jgi:tripartite-type tricarboxylate transporter receptor subunit TctC
MQSLILRVTVLASLLFAACLEIRPAFSGDGVGDFYRGKQMQFVMGFGPGTGFDSYARLIVRYLPRHLPGDPNITLQYMPGGGGLTAINYVANLAARDGTVIAMPDPVAITLPLLFPERAKFDPTSFNWIGSLNKEINTCSFWAPRLGSFADLKNSQRQVIVGGTGATSGSTVEARVIQHVLGLNFRVISGYHVFADLLLAAQQGEIDGMCGLNVSVIKSELWDQYRSGKMKVLLQAGIERSPALPGAPNAFDLLKSTEERQLLLLFNGPWEFGRPLMAPPGVPPERLDALRRAFEAMVKDPEFEADATKANLEIQPMFWEPLTRLVSQIDDTPPATLREAKNLLSHGGAQ